MSKRDHNTMLVMQPKKKLRVSFAKMRQLFGTESDDSDDDLDSLLDKVSELKIATNESVADLLALMSLKEGD